MTVPRLSRWLRALARLPRALQGALAFLSRLPVGGGRAGWNAFRRTPAAFPLAGYVLGAVMGLPFALGAEPASTVALYLVIVYGLTGVTHIDGLADLADAAAVHRGDGTDHAAGRDERNGADASGETAASRRAVVKDRRAVLKDAATGVGGTLAVALAVLALALAATALARLAAGGPPPLPGGIDGATPAVRAIATIVAAEVGAKAGMGTLACLADPAHEGLGSQLLTASRPAGIAGVALASLPAVVLAGPNGLAPLAGVVLVGPIVALAVRGWARRRLGGVSGDVFGAANELGRIAGLHVGVIAWTLS